MFLKPEKPVTCWDVISHAYSPGGNCSKSNLEWPSGNTGNVCGGFVGARELKVAIGNVMRGS